MRFSSAGETQSIVKFDPEVNMTGAISPKAASFPRPPIVAAVYLPIALRSQAIFRAMYAASASFGGKPFGNPFPKSRGKN